MQQSKITEADIQKWIKESGIMLYSADRPNVYIHRHKKIGCYERFFVNFNVASGKLLVYTADERKSKKRTAAEGDSDLVENKEACPLNARSKKRIFFATTNKEDIQKRSLYEIYYSICGYRQGKIVYKRG